MASKRRDNLYWDACIFYAWLHPEEEAASHGVNVIEGIRQMVTDFDNERIVLQTSVMTKTEVYNEKLKTQWARDRFSAMLKRRNFQLISQDERIGDKSSAIRDHYTRKGITLDAADCVHLATAIIYKSDVLYTLDRAKPNAILKLNGDPGVDRLVIRIPSAAQGNLFSNVPEAFVSSAVRPDDKIKLVSSNRRKEKPG